MNSKRPNDSDQLLADTFHNWNNGDPAQFARAAAAAARRRHRRRRAAAAAAGCAALMAVAAIAFRPPPPAPIAHVTSVPAPAYEVISDAELLSALRDRPLVAVKRENGSNEFVLVGQ
jgi:hypothetical protein